MLPHRLDQVDRAGHIVRVIQHRLGHRLPDGFAAREMNNGVEFLRAQGGVDSGGVTEVALDERHFRGLFRSGELFHALEALEEGVVEVVEDGDGVAGVEQSEDGVGA